MSKSKSVIKVKTASKIGLFLLLTTAFVFGCKKKNNNFPDEPTIEFLEFVPKGDSAVLTISFQDGNGDIGIEDDDTSVEFNMFIDYWEKDDKLGWIHQVNGAGDPTIFKYRLPVLEPNGTDKSLEGEIDVLMEPSYFNPVSSQNDTLRYDIYLYDRALNKSNVITSPEIYR